MGSVLVDLSLALICFMGNCYPALVGTSTPTGEFQLKQFSTDAPGYGGDILVFKDEGDYVFAIHRIISVPGQQRSLRLESANPSHRINVTGGCINVDPLIYERLIDCCSTAVLIVK